MKLILNTVLLILSLFLIDSDILGQNSRLDSLIAVAQTKENDSTYIRYLTHQIWVNRRVNHKTSLAILQHLDEFSRQKNNYFQQGTRLYYKGIIYKNNGMFDSSEVYLSKYAELQKGKGDKKRESSAYLALTNLYYDEGFFDKSMSAVNRSMKLNEEIQDTVLIISSNNKLASILFSTGRAKKALEIQKKTLFVATEFGDQGMICNALSNLGNAYEELGELDSMFHYYMKSNEVSDAHDLEHHKIYSYHNLGVAYKLKNDYQVANRYYQQGFDQAAQLDDYIMREYNRMGLADVAYETEKYQESENILNQAFDNAETPEQKKDIHRRLYESLKPQKKLSSALYHLEQYKSLSDSLVGLKVKNQINELEIKYDAEKKNHAIEKLTLEDQLKSARLSNQLKWISFLIIGLCMLGILFFRVFFQKQKIESQKEIITKALDEKEVLIKEIHHRVKNNLQVVSSLLSLQSRSVKDEHTSDALVEGQNRVQSMALIHQHLYKGDNVTGVSMKSYIENLCRNVFQSHSLNPENIELELDIEELELDIKTVVPLGLILNELITNACKYAFNANEKGKIYIRLSEDGQDLSVQVKDSGKGFKPEEIEKGFGYKLIQTFSKKLNAEMNIQNGNGADIHIVIKDYKTT